MRVSYSQVITSGFHPDDYGSNPYTRTNLLGSSNGRAAALHAADGGSIPSLSTKY